MRNLLIELRFVGTRYSGWQVQENAPTVQKLLCDRLAVLFHAKTDVTGCSRTDAGVHARQFFCTARTESDFPADHLVRALNAGLPDDVAAVSAREVPLSFHPRYDAIQKEYRYTFWNAPYQDPFRRPYTLWTTERLDTDAMAAAAAAFRGTHDFRGFMSSGSSVENTVRTIYVSELVLSGPELIYRVAGNGFLYNMVRIIAGTLREVGRGKLDAAELPAVIQSGRRELAGPTAPPHGLCLWQVIYNSPVFPAEEVIHDGR